MENQPSIIEGGRFDSPLVMHGAIEIEPERYIAEKPYDLTKFEFSVIRRRSALDLWFTLFAGATVGVLIVILGKTLAALLEKKSPIFETWELWAVAIGFLISVLVKFIPNRDENERAALEAVISGH